MSAGVADLERKIKDMHIDPGLRELKYNALRRVAKLAEAQSTTLYTYDYTCQQRVRNVFYRIVISTKHGNAPQYTANEQQAV